MAPRVKTGERTGPKTIRTPEIDMTIIAALQAGNTRKTAAEMAGIARDTFYDWIKKDKELLAAVERAEAEGIDERIRRIRMAGVGGQLIEKTTVTKQTKDGEIVTVTEKYTRPEWTADAWLLERKYPADFGRADRTKVELSGEGGGPIPFQLAISKEAQAAI